MKKWRWLIDYSAARSLREDMEDLRTDEESSASNERRTWIASVRKRKCDQEIGRGIDGVNRRIWRRRGRSVPGAGIEIEEAIYMEEEEEDDGITVTRVIDEWRIYRGWRNGGLFSPPARTYTTDTMLRWLCLAVTGNNSPFYILLIQLNISI